MYAIFFGISNPGCVDMTSESMSIYDLKKIKMYTCAGVISLSFSSSSISHGGVEWICFVLSDIRLSRWRLTDINAI